MSGLGYQRLQNMMGLAVVAMDFVSRVGYTMTNLPPLSEKILNASKRIFPIPPFRYSALHDGIGFFLAACCGRVTFPRQVQIRNGQLTLLDLPENFG
ncbi:MAG: hypothetical protein ONB44_03315 [candidate division KSB1 bacterium]|nr:hypothetical protein [candidate division KSB1 bacterium]